MSKPPDRVQLVKQESGAGGGDAADVDELYLELPLDPSEDAPEVQGLFFQDTVAPKDEDVYITRNGDDMIFTDVTVGTEVTLTQLLATVSGGGPHNDLRDLIHFIDNGPADGFASGAYREVVGGPFPTSIIWYDSVAKVNKIVEKTITRPTLVAPTPIVWQMYDTDGSTVLATVTDNVTYSGVFELNRTRTIA